MTFGGVGKCGGLLFVVVVVGDEEWGQVDVDLNDEWREMEDYRGDGFVQMRIKFGLGG